VTPAAHRRARWLLFVGLWILYGVTIDARDLQHYELHHSHARALAEHHRFWFREYVDGLGQAGDRFDHDGKAYANKQPGSLIAGAIAYSLLRPFGFDYLRSYFLTAAMVTLLTSSLATALTALLIERLAFEWSGRAWWSMAAALAYGAGTIAWPYSGTLHHDALAAAFLFGAFYQMEKRAFASGALLGLAASTSMLVGISGAILAATFLLRRDRTWRSRGLYVAGTMVGALPMLYYGWVSFGNPLAQGMFVSGHWVYAPLGLDGRTLPLLFEYLRLLVTFTPVAVLGLAGAMLLPPSHRRERNSILSVAAAQLVFVVATHADGACQYGPRMLLPVMPFAALGVVGFARVVRQRAAWLAVGVLGAFSATVCAVGALYGTFFCPHDRWAPARDLAAARQGIRFSLPLLEALGMPRGDAAREMDQVRAGWLAEEARVAVAVGALEEARVDLEVAAGLAPDLERVHRYAANVAYLQGDSLAAIAALERAQALAPGDSQLREQLEGLRATIGRR